MNIMIFVIYITIMGLLALFIYYFSYSNVYVERSTGIKYIYLGIQEHSKYGYAHVFYKKGGNLSDVKIVDVYTPISDVFVKSIW